MALLSDRFIADFRRFVKRGVLPKPGQRLEWVGRRGAEDETPFRIRGAKTMKFSGEYSQVNLPGAAYLHIPARRKLSASALRIIKKVLAGDAEFIGKLGQGRPTYATPTRANQLSSEVGEDDYAELKDLLKGKLSDEDFARVCELLDGGGEGDDEEAGQRELDRMGAHNGEDSEVDINLLRNEKDRRRAAEDATIRGVVKGLRAVFPRASAHSLAEKLRSSFPRLSYDAALRFAGGAPASANADAEGFFDRVPGARAIGIDSYGTASQERAHMRAGSLSRSLPASPRLASNIARRDSATRAALDGGFGDSRRGSGSFFDRFPEAGRVRLIGKEEWR